jgi:hypothetical protein
MSYVRDYATDTTPLSSWTRGELEALVSWLRQEKSRALGNNLTLMTKLDRLDIDLKFILEANVVMRAECDMLRARNAQLEISDGC